MIDSLDSAYKRVIKPIAKSVGYPAMRIDEVKHTGKIDTEILKQIAASKIILADLTKARPNCYYEAGFAHALGKEVIFTIMKDSQIHFDLSNYKFIIWETEEELSHELKPIFRHIAKELKSKFKKIRHP